MRALPKKILLATDGSEDAALAARVATDIAATGGSEVHVVYVLEPLTRYAYPGVTPEIYSLVDDARRERANKLLDREAERLRDEGANVAGVQLKEGPVVDEILDASDELRVGLVVMGSRGLGLVKNLLLGSVSEGMVHHSRCPVLVARGGRGAWPPERVVIADDDSETARQAGRLAAQITVGDPAAVILKEAQGENVLVAVGSRGLGPIRRMRLGSISTKVLRAAKGPVLVYPREG